MSVFNHTPTAAAGSQMVATDVTTPDASLDSAIGNRATLTTTATSSLVAAVNELVTSIAAITANSWVTAARIATGAITTAKIAAGAVTSTELGAAAVTTAKLAASAVTANELATDAVTTAKITNLNVTGGKIARDAFAPPNVFVDATFQTVPLKISAEWGIGGHTLRWHPRSQSSLDDTAVLVFDDTNNPMGIRLRTLRYKGTSASTVFGWYVSTAEAGWKAGDVISGVIYGNAPAGTFAHNIRCYNAAGVALGSVQSGTGQVMSGTPTALNNSGAVIDAGAAYVLFYINRTAGSNDFDVYWRYGGAGVILPQVPSGQGYLPQMGVPRKRAADARHLLADYNAQASKILGADGTSQVDVVYLADSWGQRLIIAPVLRTWLQAQYGDGGLGWVSFYITYNQGSTYWEGLSTSGGATVRAGTWSSGDSARQTDSHGPDITHVSTTDAAATMKLTTTVTFTAVDILAYKQTNGGTYEYRIDGGSWVAVATAGTAGVLVTSITGLGNTTHVIEFQVNTIGTDGLVFLGLNLKKSGNGARLHRLAIGSSTAAHWTQVNATDWQTGLAALTPNLVIASLGVNDRNADTPPQTYGAQMATLASRVWAARALCDVMFVSPCDTADGTRTYTMAQMASALRTVAASLEVAYEDWFAVMPVNADAVARSSMEPLSGGISKHPSLSGGRLLAQRLINNFLRLV
jgi:hypothetical protein